MSAPRLLLSCVAEDCASFHARVENLVITARDRGGSLARSPIVVKMVESADHGFVRRMSALDAEVQIVARFNRGGVAHANKLRMLEIGERDDFDVLLAVDCDIAAAEDPARHLVADAISVVPADVDAFSESEWRAIFAGLALDRPDRSLTATTSGKPMYPYFNSGVLGVPRPLCDELLSEWTRALNDVAQLWRLRPRLNSRKARFYTEQLALAVALARGLPHRAVSRELNFATHVKLHEPTVRELNPVLLHYHAEFDEQGFLLRPRSPTAERAADLVNRSRARALNLAYEGLRSRRAIRRAAARVTRQAIGRLRPSPSRSHGVARRWVG